jgi:hypothetical protein
MSTDDRRSEEAHQRVEDRMVALLESLQEAQTQGMKALGDAIAKIDGKVEVMASKNGEAALKAAVDQVKLEARIAAVESENIACRVERDRLRKDIEPLQQAFWKTTGMAIASAALISTVLEVLDVFGHHK